MTDEDPALVDKWFAKNKPDYPIAILKNEEVAGFVQLPIEIE